MIFNAEPQRRRVKRTEGGIGRLVAGTRTWTRRRTFTGGNNRMPEPHPGCVRRNGRRYFSGVRPAAFGLARFRLRKEHATFARWTGEGGAEATQQGSRLTNLCGCRNVTQCFV